MFKMLDFHCNACASDFEALAESDERPPCKACGSGDTARTPPRAIGRPFEVIKATTRTSRRFKAGYIHQYNRPKEKISVSVPASVG